VVNAENWSTRKGGQRKTGQRGKIPKMPSFEPKQIGFHSKYIGLCRVTLSKEFSSITTYVWPYYPYQDKSDYVYIV
jgi:hypothetical protein